MKETTVHRPVAEHRRRAGVRIRKNRFRSELIADLLEFPRYLVIGLIPGNSSENLRDISAAPYTMSFWRDARHWILNTIWGVDAVEILRNLGAEKSACDWVIWITAQARCAAEIVNRDKHATRVRTIVRAGSMNDSGHEMNSL